jgi:hypothetical protein
LIVVSGTERSSVDFTRWKRLKGVIVEPLLQRSILASELDNLLGHNTSKEGSQRRDTAR